MGVPRLSPFTVIKVYNYNNFLYPSKNAVYLLGPGDMIVTIAGCSVAYLYSGRLLWWSFSRQICVCVSDLYNKADTGGRKNPWKEYLLFSKYVMDV